MGNINNRVPVSSIWHLSPGKAPPVPVGSSALCEQKDAWNWEVVEARTSKILLFTLHPLFTIVRVHFPRSLSLQSKLCNRVGMEEKSIY